MIGYRKAAAVAVMLLIGIVVVVFKGDVPPNFLTLLEFLFGAFVVGNGVEHVSGVVKASYEAADDSTPDVITTQVQQANDALALIQKTLAYIMQRTGMSGPTQPPAQ